MNDTHEHWSKPKTTEPPRKSKYPHDINTIYYTNVDKNFSLLTEKENAYKENLLSKKYEKQTNPLIYIRQVQIEVR